MLNLKVKCPKCNTNTEDVWEDCPNCGENLGIIWIKQIKNDKDGAIILFIIGFICLLGGIYGLTAGYSFLRVPTILSIIFVVLLFIWGGLSYSKISSYESKMPIPKSKK